MADERCIAAESDESGPRPLPKWGGRCRRSSARLSIRCRATLHDPQGRLVVAGTTKDLSNGGMLIHSPVAGEITTGRQVRTQVAVPRRNALGDYIEEVCAAASVVRTRPVEDSNGDTISVALRYVEPMPLLVANTVRGRIVPIEPHRDEDR